MKKFLPVLFVCSLLLVAGCNPYGLNDEQWTVVKYAHANELHQNMSIDEALSVLTNPVADSPRPSPFDHEPHKDVYLIKVIIDTSEAIDKEGFRQICLDLYFADYQEGGRLIHANTSVFSWANEDGWVFWQLVTLV